MDKWDMSDRWWQRLNPLRAYRRWWWRRHFRRGYVFVNPREDRNTVGKDSAK